VRGRVGGREERHRLPRGADRHTRRQPRQPHPGRDHDPLERPALGTEPVDVDREVELRLSKPIAQIFAEDGEPAFRATEEEVTIELLRERPGPAVVSLGGGASTVKNYLAAGLLDELLISLVPIFLGAGARLLDDLGSAPRQPVQTEVVEAPGVTHLRYRFD